MIPEIYKIVPVMKEADLSSTVETDGINMKNFHRATFIFSLNTLGGASSVLTVTSGAADGANTSEISFKYAFGGAAIGTAAAGSASSCDVLADWTDASTLTLTYGTYSDYMLVVVVDAAKMDVANSEEWLSCVFTTTSSVTGNVTGFAILEPRYEENNSETALA